MAASRALLGFAYSFNRESLSGHLFLERLKVTRLLILQRRNTPISLVNNKHEILSKQASKQEERGAFVLFDVLCVCIGPQ